MSEEPDLVRLLYRADWTRLSLAAEVSVSQDPGRDRAQSEARRGAARARVGDGHGRAGSRNRAGPPC